MTETPTPTPTGAERIAARRLQHLTVTTVEQDAEQVHRILTDAAVSLNRAAADPHRHEDDVLHVGALMAAALDALAYTPPTPAVRGEELTTATVLVEGMGAADGEGSPWWWAGGEWRYALSAHGGPGLTSGPGLTTAKLLAGESLLITYVPEATS